MALLLAQELDEGAVRALIEASSESRAKFMDAAFLRQKRRAGAGAQQGSASRPWYPNIDIWLLGTSGPSADEAHSGLEVRLFSHSSSERQTLRALHGGTLLGGSWALPRQACSMHLCA